MFKGAVNLLCFKVSIAPLKVSVMVLLSLLLLTGCLKQELQTGLTEAEAQEVIVLLKDHGLEAVRLAQELQPGVLVLSIVILSLP